jgi:hypothetical protein
MTFEPTPARRTHIGRTAITARLEQAIAELTASEGFDAVNPRAIALRAGTSIRPAYDRYEDRSTIALALWESVGRDACTSLIVDVAEALVAGDHVAAATFITTRRTDTTVRGCIRELLLLAAFDTQLRTSIHEHLVSRFSAADPEIRVRWIAALTVATGIVTSAKDLDGPFELDLPLSAVATALTQNQAPEPLPDIIAPFMELQPIATGDRTIDAVLNAALTAIAHDGYRATTMDRICERAGLSEGAIFGRYATKLDLIIDIIERRQREAMATSAAFTADLTVSVGPALTEAVLWREHFRPEHRPACCLAMEVERLALHEPRLASRLNAARAMFAADYLETLEGRPLAEAKGSIDFGICLGAGLQVTAVLYPEGFALPFNVVTAGLQH